jgi:hypothetical protein
MVVLLVWKGMKAGGRLARTGWTTVRGRLTSPTEEEAAKRTDRVLKET